MTAARSPRRLVASAGPCFRSWAGGAAVFVAAAVACSPVFFILFRLMAFNTVPRDDYAPFLLWLLGAPGGGLPESPYGYRVLSMIAAAPLYWLLPAPPLTNLPAGLAAPYLRATAALAMLSYLSLLLMALVIYRVGRDRAALGRVEAVLGAVLLVGLALNCQLVAIDPLAILLVAAGLWLLPRPGGFAALIVPSVFCNEKVAIVFALWLTLRCLTSVADRRRFGLQWAATLAAIALYAVVLRVVHLPGNSYQLRPTGYLATLVANLGVLRSARGVLLDLLPTLLLFAVGALGWRCCGDRLRATWLRPRDLLVIPGLMLVALVLTQKFQMGRIVMHAAPLFVLPAAAALGQWLARGAAPDGAA